MGAGPFSLPTGAGHGRETIPPRNPDRAGASKSLPLRGKMRSCTFIRVPTLTARCSVWPACSRNRWRRTASPAGRRRRKDGHSPTFFGNTLPFTLSRAPARPDKGVQHLPGVPSRTDADVGLLKQPHSGRRIHGWRQALRTRLFKSGPPSLHKEYLHGGSAERTRIIFHALEEDALGRQDEELRSPRGNGGVDRVFSSGWAVRASTTEEQVSPTRNQNGI